VIQTDYYILCKQLLCKHLCRQNWIHWLQSARCDIIE